jgi:hypothetical protein
MPQGSNEAVANNIIRITLPANSLVNLRSFALHFSAAVTAGTVGRLPNRIDSLVERVEVSVGGVQVSSGNNYYNVLCHAVAALTGETTDSVLGHPEVAVRTSYHTGADISGGNESIGNYCIDTWKGFLGTCEPRILDLSLLPEMVVSIYLADNNVLINSTDTSGNFASGASAVTPTYQLKDICATIETIGLADGTYDAMVNQMMGQVGFLEIPFKQYVSFHDHPHGNMRFSVATQSLDRIWIAQRAHAFDTVHGAVLPPMYSDILGAEGAAGAVLGLNKMRYISHYFKFHSNSTPHTKYFLQLNGSMVPQFQASYEQMHQISKNSVPLKKVQKEFGLETQKDSFAVQCVRLNLEDSEFSRKISGLDTRGISLNANYQITNAHHNARPVTLFCEMTSTLRIGAGLAVEIVQ